MKNRVVIQEAFMGKRGARRARPLVVRYIALMTVVAVVLIALFGDASGLG